MKSLQHPNRDGTILSLRFTPDGKRIIGGDYPGGIVQIWDVESGKQLMKVETGAGYRGSSEYFFLTPDWSTIFVPSEKRTVTKSERDGKKVYRLETDGGVQAWDLKTGKVRESFRCDPPHSVRMMCLSPDGQKFVTFDELPGEIDLAPPRGGMLWDVPTKQARSLGKFFPAVHAFSPDGRLLVGSQPDEMGFSTEIRLLDTKSGTAIRTIPIEAMTLSEIWGFSPDSKYLVASPITYPARLDRSSSRSALRLWEVATGSEFFKLSTDEPKSGFSGVECSPDNKMLVATSWRSAKAKVYLINISERRLAKTIEFEEKEFVRKPVFSPDGHWLVIVTQSIPDESKRRATVDETPQARIHLIDMATRAVRETLIAPPGFVVSACFSPDGKTLATGGRGKVHLWDVSNLR